MLVLYDNVASVAAQKVRVTLAEKGLDWTTVAVDLRNGDVMRPQYLALNPRGVVPTLVHDGEVLTESSVIIEYLDDIAPQPPLRPASPLARARMRGWMRRVDDDIHRATGNLSMAIYIRQSHLAKSLAERYAYFAAMPDRDRAARQQAAIASGLATPSFAPSVKAFATLIDEIDSGLGTAPWLAGESFTLADIAVAPYVMRLDMLAMDRLWSGGRRPAFERWWQHMQQRPSWKNQVHDAFSAATRAHMLARGREAWPTVSGILEVA